MPVNEKSLPTLYDSSILKRQESENISLLIEKKGTWDKKRDPTGIQIHQKVPKETHLGTVLIFEILSQGWRCQKTSSWLVKTCSLPQELRKSWVVKTWGLVLGVHFWVLSFACNKI